MPSIRQLEEQGRALLEDQKTLVLDEKRPWPQKRAEYDKREADIKAVIDQLNALRAVDAQPWHSSLGDLHHGPRTLKGYNAGLVASGYRPVGTPQMDLEPEQAKELHEAAVSHKSLAIDLKATDSTSVAPSTITDYRLPPVTMRREPTRVLSLIPTFATEHPSVTWYSTTGTTAADAVAEGGTKPTSTIAYTAVTGAVTKLAHVAEVTDETLQDFPAFMGVLQSDMFAGLVKKENDELLNATVTGAHKFAGLLNVSGILTRARVAELYFDAIELAMEDLRNGSAFAEADGMVMNPTTWGLLRRTKDSNGRHYIQPDVTQGHSPNVWNVPVVTTTQIAAGTILIGDFAGSTAAYIRDGIRIDTNTMGEAQFKANTCLIRAEERLLVTAPRPTGLLKLTGIS